jgi:predicted Zn-dependent protease
MSPETGRGTAADASPIDHDEARALLAEAVASSGAEHTTVLLEAHDASLTRFANNEIHQNVASTQRTLTVRAMEGLRVGWASTNRVDAAGLREVTDRARNLARLSPEDPEAPGPAGPQAYEPISGHVDATARCTPEERAEAIAPVVRAAQERGLNAAGALSTAANVLAIADSGGLFAYHPDTTSQFTCTVRGADSSGWCDRHRRDWRELDVERLGRIAIEKAERSRGPGDLAPGPYTVILEPSAVAELVGFLAWLGLGALHEQEGRSFLSGKLGERVTGDWVTLVDDARDPRGFGRPFDYEGMPRRRVVGIERGVARAVVHDRRTARKAGVESTGHACAPPAIEGPIPFDLVLATGTQSVDDLVASTERGILVTRFWYCRVVDARRTLITGMTRDGTFLIENGRLARGLKNLRFNESVLGVLERAEGVGREAEPTLFDYTNNTVVVPALKARDFSFTGTTQF